MSSNNETNERKIMLNSADGDLFEVSYEAAKLSKLVEGVMEDENEEDEESHIDIIKVKSECLQKVVDFLEHHQKEPLNKITHSMEADTFDEIVTQEWYRTFITVELPLLFQLVQAANYMNIQELLDLACLQVANNLMKKSAEDIRKMLKIPKMTPEEEQKARQEHRWIFEA